MALFNQPTQYTTDVSSVNNQVAKETADSAQFFGQLISAEYAYQSQTSKLMEQVGPLIGKAGKFV